MWTLNAISLARYFLGIFMTSLGEVRLAFREWTGGLHSGGTAFDVIYYVVVK